MSFDDSTCKTSTDDIKFFISINQLFITNWVIKLTEASFEG